MEDGLRPQLITLWLAIALWSMPLGYWNFTEIITCLGPLHTQKDNPCWPAIFFHNLLVNTHPCGKITKSHPFQWILHKCQMISMCSKGQYAAFSVNKMHISKTYILFPIKCTQTTHNSNMITRQKKYNKKTTFSRKYFPILVNQMER